MIDQPLESQWHISFHSLWCHRGHCAVFQDDGFTGISKCLLMPFTQFAEISHLNKWFEDFVRRCQQKNHWFLLFVAVITSMSGEETRIQGLMLLKMRAIFKSLEFS